MKYYLKRDKSDENSRYMVYSDAYEPVYEIKGKHHRGQSRCFIMQGDNCVCKIVDTSLALIRTCHITTKLVSTHLVIAQVKDKYTITYHGVSLHIRGDVLSSSYDILNVDNTVVACVSRRFSAHSDALELNIFDSKFELITIASAVCFDSICLDKIPALQVT